MGGEGWEGRGGGGPEFIRAASPLLSASPSWASCRKLLAPTLGGRNDVHGNMDFKDEPTGEGGEGMP